MRSNDALNHQESTVYSRCMFFHSLTFFFRILINKTLSNAHTARSTKWCGNYIKKKERIFFSWERSNKEIWAEILTKGFGLMCLDNNRFVWTIYFLSFFLFISSLLLWYFYLCIMYCKPQRFLVYFFILKEVFALFTKSFADLHSYFFFWMVFFFRLKFSYFGFFVFFLLEVYRSTNLRGWNLHRFSRKKRFG